VSGIRSHEGLWEAIHAALDARRDPLAVDAVASWLAEHPEDLEEVLRLEAGLRVLERPRRRPAWPLAALAAAAAIALVFWLREPASPRSEVFEYRLSISTETPTTRTTSTLDNGTLIRERTERLGLPGAASSFATLTTTTRKEGLR
jgi:hypothetical protein